MDQGGTICLFRDQQISQNLWSEQWIETTRITVHLPFLHSLKYFLKMSRRSSKLPPEPHFCSPPQVLQSVLMCSILQDVLCFSLLYSCFGIWFMFNLYTMVVPILVPFRATSNHQMCLHFVLQGRGKSWPGS